MSLETKIAIVTGGARGIGRAIVRALAAQKAKVSFTYVSPSSKEIAESLVAEIKQQGGEALSIQIDVADIGAPEAIMQATQTGFGCANIDILVNNAGLGGNTRLQDIVLEEYERLMAVNVRAIIFMTQTVLPHIRPGGRVVNLSSISARGGYATQTVYAASKAAVEGLTRVWATELGQQFGITVNAVNPGPVDTDMYRAAGSVHLARMAEENQKVPAAARCGTPCDIADIVLFLCEERSRWVTGEVLCANGGMLFT